MQKPDEKAVFNAARRIADPADRRSYVEQACAADPAVGARVQALLRLYDEGGDFLRVPDGGLPDDAGAPVIEGPGARVGAYRLLEPLGEGGFGVVYLAEQTQPVRRQVALKVLKPGMDTRQVVARFQAERQALALMDHPHIARVLDGGETASGRPYFVMELFRGAPITDFCDGHQLTVRQRLEQFLPVCEAVQHAHQKGVIHRDLKPSNVLVARCDGTPAVKVIDFGIAKALGQKLTDNTLVTNAALVLGTPLYMSPEQAEGSGLDIDTRSDIYALGVLLYELLTGTTPFDRGRLQTAGFDEVRRIIREEEPARPSARVTTLADHASTVSVNRRCDPKRLSRLLRGELDWVVMKCLEKDRDRRYDTANGLAMDVQRYLSDEPVLACPPSAGYRVKKFLRRHKGPVLAAGLVFLALVGGVIGTAWGLVRAGHALQREEEQRRAAVAAQERAEQGFDKAKGAVEQYLQAVTDNPDLKYKHDLHALRKKLVEAAVPYYQWFTEQKPGEAALEAERGRAYHRLAFVRMELGEKEAALKDYERMRTIFDRLAADFPDVPAYRQELAQSHNNLGFLLETLGQRPAAERAYRRTRDIFEKLTADFPGEPEYRQELARSHSNLGRLLKDLGHLTGAEQAYRRALEIREKLAADFPRVAVFRLDLASSYNNLGLLWKALGQPPRAEQPYRRALEIQEKLAADFPSVPEYRLALAGSHGNLGNLLRELGQRPAAEQAHRRALELDERLTADFPSVPEYRQDLARSYNNLGLLLSAQGQRPAAEQAYRRALEVGERLAADFPTVPEYRQDLARCHHNLGLLLAAQGQRPAAEQAHRRARDIFEKLAADFPTVPEYRQELAVSHNSLGVLLKNLGQRPAAEQAYRRALEIREQLAADFPAVSAYRLDLAGSCVNFGNLLRDQGQAAAGLAWHAKAVALLEPLVQQEPRLVTGRLFLRNAHLGRAEALDKLGRHADAAEEWDRALARNPRPADEPVIRRGRALSLARAGDHARAVAEANALAGAKDVDSDTLYDLACACAVASAAVTEAKTPGADATRLAEEYAARAVELLRQAVARGYQDAAQMKRDRDLNVLRDRADFQRLLPAVGAKSPP